MNAQMLIDYGRGLHQLCSSLSYPEVLGLGRMEGTGQFFYNGTVADLAEKLGELALRVEERSLWPPGITPAILTDHLKWRNLAPEYDKALAGIRPPER